MLVPHGLVLGRRGGELESEVERKHAGIEQWRTDEEQWWYKDDKGLKKSTVDADNRNCQTGVLLPTNIEWSIN